MLKIARHPSVPNAQMPVVSAGNAGLDLITPVDIVFPRGKQGIFVVDTGLVLEMPDASYSARVLPRSSWTKLNLDLVGSGLIDYSYKGPDDTLKVVITRFSSTHRKFVKSVPLSEYNDRFNDINHDNIYMKDGDPYYIVEEVKTLDPLVYRAGERFAQIVVSQHHDAFTNIIRFVDHKDWTGASRGGFGSTGN